MSQWYRFVCKLSFSSHFPAKMSNFTLRLCRRTAFCSGTNKDPAAESILSQSWIHNSFRFKRVHFHAFFCCSLHQGGRWCCGRHSRRHDMISEFMVHELIVHTDCTTAVGWCPQTNPDGHYYYNPELIYGFSQNNAFFSGYMHDIEYWFFKFPQLLCT